jgi:membrane protease YdiL (CAAX protease family)
VTEVRPLPARSASERPGLLVWSLLVGCGLGLGNLTANYTIAALDPAIHRQMIEQWSRFTAWSAVFAGPIVEEIGYRLLLTGGTAWLLSRWTRDRRILFLVPLTVSSLLFGVAHILPSSRPTTGALQAAGVMLKSSAAGAVLGWVFWRKGLPYSVTCHCIANAVHLLAWPAVFMT